jgi:TIR domain
MSGVKTDKADFFISYTSTDTEIAEWIAWQLEEADYSVVFQKWDFIPGSSFVNEMRGALEYAQKMVAVISDAYFKSKFAMSEWDAAFAEDPNGMNRTLIPVRVENFDVSGLAKPRVYIDIVGCDESMANQRLLDGIKGKRLKPRNPPKFPLKKHPSTSAVEEPPRNEQGAEVTSEKPEIDDEVYIPQVKKKWTDKEKDAFLKDTFEGIYGYFEKAKAALEQHHPEAELNLEQINSRKFVCRLYVNGTKKNSCKLWISHDYGRGKISFSEGANAEPSSDNSYNEILTVNEADNKLFLSAGMFMYVRETKGIDKDRLSPEQASEYLWKRFSASLSC